jgi:hypothetical protein
MSRLASMLKKKRPQLAVTASEAKPKAKKQKLRSGYQDPASFRSAGGSNKSVKPGGDRAKPQEDEDGEQEQPLHDAEGAYHELVGLLSSRGGAAAAMLRRRQHEEGGDSEGGSSSAGDGEEEVRVVCVEWSISVASRASDPSCKNPPAHLTSLLWNQPRQEDERAQAAGRQQEQKEDDGGADGSGGPEDGGDGGDDSAPSATADGAAAAATAADGPALDTWSDHLDRELSEDAAAALRAGGTVKFTAPEASPSDALFAGPWPGRAQWQVAGRAALPPAPGGLAACGVRDRLQARWREVHQVRGGRGVGGVMGAGPG